MVCTPLHFREREGRPPHFPFREMELWPPPFQKETFRVGGHPGDGRNMATRQEGDQGNRGHRQRGHDGCFARLPVAPLASGQRFLRRNGGGNARDAVICGSTS